MAHAVTLPVVAGLSLLGAAAGVHLGRATISEINPAYYVERDSVFHADLVPHRSPDWAQVQAAEYQQAQSVDGLGTGCVRCRDYPEEYYPRPEAPVETYADGWAAGPAPVETVYVEPAPREEWVRVERYAAYPVSSDEAEIIQAPAADSEAPPEEDYAAGE